MRGKEENRLCSGKDSKPSTSIAKGIAFIRGRLSYPINSLSHTLSCIKASPFNVEEVQASYRLQNLPSVIPCFDFGLSF